MYLTGTYLNLENRLHQLATGQSDLLLYNTEGSGYINILPTGEKRDLAQEVRKKYLIFNNRQTGLYFGY